MGSIENINLVAPIIAGLMKNINFILVSNDEPLLFFLNMKGGTITEKIAQTFINNIAKNFNICTEKFQYINFDGSKIDDSMPTEDFNKIIYKIYQLDKYYWLVLESFEIIIQNYILAEIMLKNIANIDLEEQNIYNIQADKLYELKKNILKLFYFCIYYKFIVGRNYNEIELDTKIYTIRNELNNINIEISNALTDNYELYGANNSVDVLEKRIKIIEEIERNDNEQATKKNVKANNNFKIPKKSTSDINFGEQFSSVLEMRKTPKIMLK